MQNFLKLLMVTLMLATANLYAKHDGRYLNKLSLDYKTAHLDWGGKLPGKKLNTLFIVARKGGREAIEVRQRLPMNYQAVATVNALQIAREDVYEGAVEGTSPFEKKQELLKKLKQPYDLIVLGNFNFEKLPAEARFRILSKVAEGSGLLIVFPRKMKLKKILAHPIKGAETIVSGISLSGFPANGSKLNKKDLVKTYSFGKGRISLIDWKANHSAYWLGNSLTPQYNYSSLWAAEYENMMVLLLRTIAWTTNRGILDLISSKQLSKKPELSYGNCNITLATNQQIDLTYRIRNKYNTTITEKRIEANGSINIPASTVPAGEYTLDYIARNAAGETLDTGFYTFKIKSPFGKLTLSSPNESIPENGTINATLKLETAPKTDTEVQIQMIDSPYGRSWYKQILTLPQGKKTLQLSLPKYYIPTLAGYLKCNLMQNKQVIASTQKLLFFPKNKLEMFPTIAWGAVPSSNLAPLYADLAVKDMGWRAGLTHPSKDGTNARSVALLDQRFVPYTVRIMLGAETKDKQKLGWTKQASWFFLPNAKKRLPELNGDESFYNPKAKQFWKESIKHRIKNLPKYGPAVYNLGDENYFNHNAGFSPSDNKEFKNFLKARYGTIQKLNATWGTTYKNFSNVKHFTLKEAVAKKIYPAWFDHRLFMEKQYADLHHFLASEIKKQHPEAIVGAEGSVPGNLEESIKGLEFWGPYSNLVMDEVLRSIGGNRIRGLWWGGYVGSHGGRDVYPLPLWKDLILGNINSSLWYSSSVASPAAMIGSDLSYAHYFRQLRPHLKALDTGIAQLLINTPLENNGISILWSHSSDAARFLDPRFANPHSSLGALIRYCYSNGLSFDFTTPRTIKTGLKNKKILFLCGSNSISTQTAKAIKDFANNGGTVIADMPPALLDEYLKEHKANPLAELFGNIQVSQLKNPELDQININSSIDSIPFNLKAEKSYTHAGLTQFQVRKIGKGHAILLNTSLAGVENTQDSTTPLASFLGNIMKLADVSQPIKLSGISKKNIFFRVRQGKGFKVIALLANKDDIGKSVTFTLPKSSYIYDAASGYMCHDNRISCKLDIPFQVFTLYDKDQEKPTVSLIGEVKAVSAIGSLFSSTDYYAKQGAIIIAKIANAQPDTIYLLTITNPDDKILTTRTQVIVCDKNQQSIPIHFAFNDKKGNYKIQLEAINTDLKTSFNVELD